MAVNQTQGSDWLSFCGMMGDGSELESQNGKRGNHLMFFMIGITNGQKDLEHNQTEICDICGRYGRFEVFMTYTQLLLFFIPVFKWNRQYFVRMSCCGAMYTLNPEVGARIARGEDVTIQKDDLMRMSRNAADMYGASGTYGSGTGYGSSGSGGSLYEQSRRAWSETGGSAENTPAKIHHRCVICGYETDEDFKYCPKCGQRF